MGLPVAEKGARGPEVAVCFSANAVPGRGEDGFFPSHLVSMGANNFEVGRPVSIIVLICQNLIVPIFFLIL